MSRAGVEKLGRIASKRERLVIGLMSGTSLDGLDIALCRIEGSGFDTKLSVEEFETVAYTDDFRRQVREVFAKRDTDLEAVTLLGPIVADLHAKLIATALKSWSVAADDIDLIASHGQTVYHAPRSLHGRQDAPNATLQLGDGDHLAVRTGIMTISDFRQKHIAAGGEGAPLASYGDVLLLSDPKRPRLLLNIGGIANYTFLPATKDTGEAFSTDIGPGNTLMDALMHRRSGSTGYDLDAKLARSGMPHGDLLQALKQEPFFSLPAPKTTGPELFSLAWVEEKAQTIGISLSDKDLMATLNRLSAETIAEAIDACDGTPDVYLSGGGAQNPLLVETLCALLPSHRIATTEELGIHPDAKEAVLFAVLANELVAGDPETFRGRIKGGPAVTMGKISFPD